jgi:hypothetical protein
MVVLMLVLEESAMLRVRPLKISLPPMLAQEDHENLFHPPGEG